MVGPRSLEVVIALKLEKESRGWIAGNVDQFSHLALIACGNPDSPVSWLALVREYGEIDRSRHLAWCNVFASHRRTDESAMGLIAREHRYEDEMRLWTCVF
jgi:hypothetical protein